MGKPTIYAGENGVDIVILSPDSSKAVTLGLTNDGTVTLDGIPLIVEDATGHEVTEYNGKGLQTKIVLYTDETMANGRIREETIVYSGSKPSIVTTEFFDTNDVVSKTITETFSYTSNKLTSRSKTVT